MSSQRQKLLRRHFNGTSIRRMDAAGSSSCHRLPKGPLEGKATERHARKAFATQLLGDAALALGAIWTLSCNLSYAAGWSLRNASLLALTVLTATTALIVLLRRRRALQALPPALDWAVCEKQHDRAHLALAAASIVGLAAWAVFWRTYVGYWLMAVPLLALVYWHTARAQRTSPSLPATHVASRPRLMILLCLGAAVTTLMKHLPSGDDGVYLNRAAALADNFSTTMRTGCTLFEKSTPFLYPSYPLTAYHDFIGLLSWLTGMQPLALSAFILAPAAAILVIVAYAQLCRTVFGPRWAWALAGVFVLMAAGGPTMYHFANFGFARMSQGKSLILHLVVPLAAAAGLRYGATGRRRDLLRLAASAVTAVGVSSIGLWLLPASAVLAVGGGIRRQRHLVPRTAAAVAACAYPLLIGVVCAGGSAADAAHMRDDRSFEALMEFTFGGKLAVTAWAGVILLAPILAPGLAARRFLIVGVLGALLTLINPALFDLIIKYVTSPIVFWRVIWVLPALPVLAAALLITGFNIPNTRVRAVTGPGVWCLLTAGLVGLTLLKPAGIALLPVRIGPPGLNVIKADYQVIELLMARLPPGSRVMAPEDVTWMMPAFRRRLSPVAPRAGLVEHTIQHQLGDPEDAAWRYLSLHMAAGAQPTDATALSQLVERYDLRGVVMAAGLPGFTVADKTLRKMGFLSLSAEKYAVWIRP